MDSAGRGGVVFRLKETAMFDAPKTPADAYVRHGSLKVAAELDTFVRDQAAADTGVSAAAFWDGVEGLLARFGRRN
ncbi:MAG TPA: malate synthase G, partial [Brevundimonas sp.]|nr:malate synthase G [Brevundimonas sp.]